jgi:hypothetical protein
VGINAIYNVTRELAKKLIKINPAENLAKNQEKIVAICAANFAILIKNVNHIHVKPKFSLNANADIVKLLYYVE